MSHLPILAPPRRSGRIHWAALAFLVGFTALLLIVCYGYLFPAMEAAKSATETEKHGLAAYSRLLLVLVLLVLYAGLLLTFRVSRFFLPRSTGTPTRTAYTDAWAEAGRRVKVSDEAGPDDGA